MLEKFNSVAIEYDVWRCFTNGRTTYKCVETNGVSLDDIKPPENGVDHLNRIVAPNARRAVSNTLAMEGKGKNAVRPSRL